MATGRADVARSRRSAADTADTLERAIGSVVESRGHDLVDVELVGGVLRVTVERDGGLDLDELAEMSRLLGALLDERSDLAPSGRYELEVSSPGVERRLRRPAHFTKALGRRVAVRTIAGTPGERRFEGTLWAVDADAITVTDDGGAEHRVPYPAIDRAHTVFDWRAALAGGRAPASSATTGSQAS
jgi:ribosome maturation factor RimP